MIPGLAVFWVIVIVLAVAFVLDRGLFKPLGRVMQQRQQAIHAAQELARQSAERAREATEEFEAKTRAAQAEIYREMDENRREATERRAALVTATRQEVAAQLAEASSRLDAQAAEARATLEKDAEALGEAIVERVLGRTPPPRVHQ